METSIEDLRSSIISYLIKEDLELYDFNVTDFPNVSKVEIFVYSTIGLDHKTIERLSYQFQDVLQDFNIERGTYDLVVSTPGIEPILRTPRHFEIAMNKSVKIKTFNDICGEYLFLGILTSVNNKEITIMLEDRNVVDIDIENIKKGKVILNDKVASGK